MPYPPWHIWFTEFLAILILTIALASVVLWFKW